jgi:hypothetical protein
MPSFDKLTRLKTQLENVNWRKAYAFLVKVMPKEEWNSTFGAA